MKFACDICLKLLTNKEIIVRTFNGRMGSGMFKFYCKECFNNFKMHADNAGDDDE